MADNNWGRWGEDDERGALNLLDAETVLSAAASITTGKAYNLGIPIQSQGVPLLDFRGTPMRLTLTNESDEGMFEFAGCPPGTGSHEDMLVFASHTTSHIDALSHVYEDGEHYNGFPASSMKTHTGAAHLGIEKIGAIAARVVMLDFVKHRGADGWLEFGSGISGEEIESCAAAQGVEIRSGDVVLLRTGYLDAWHALQPDVGFAQPGLDADGARWLVARDVVAVGADNAAVEMIPFDDNEYLVVHKTLLVRAGIYMLEFLNLAELAADECYEGLITIAPLLVTGAAGSPVNPVVIG